MIGLWRGSSMPCDVLAGNCGTGTGMAPSRAMTSRPPASPPAGAPRPAAAPGARLAAIGWGYVDTEQTEPAALMEVGGWLLGGPQGRGTWRAASAGGMSCIGKMAGGAWAETDTMGYSVLPDAAPASAAAAAAAPPGGRVQVSLPMQPLAVCRASYPDQTWQAQFCAGERRRRLQPLQRQGCMQQAGWSGWRTGIAMLQLQAGLHALPQATRRQPTPARATAAAPFSSRGQTRLQTRWWV